MLFRMYMVLLGDQQNAEDVVQDTLVSYWKTRPDSQNAEHEKAWLIRVAADKSKDRLRSWLRRSTAGMKAFEGITEYPNDFFVLEQLVILPYKDKMILYLHYVEGYRLWETGDLLSVKGDAVRTIVRRGRGKLKLQIKEISAK